MQIINGEVVMMERDAVWQAFSETGDPVYYLLYKSMHENNANTKENDRRIRPGEQPRPED